MLEIVVVLFGAQLTIAGSIVFLAHQDRGEVDQLGVPLLVIGVLISLAAVVRAGRANSQ